MATGRLVPRSKPRLQLQSPADDARPIVRVAGVPLRLPLITEHGDDVARYRVQHAGDELRLFPTIDCRADRSVIGVPPGDCDRVGLRH